MYNSYTIERKNKEYSSVLLLNEFIVLSQLSFQKDEIIQLKFDRVYWVSVVNVGIKYKSK